MTDFKSSTKQVSNVNIFNFQTLKHLLIYKEKNFQVQINTLKREKIYMRHGVLVTITKNPLKILISN